MAEQLEAGPNSDIEGFHRYIAAHPDEPLALKVYADWMDENNHQYFAHLLRVVADHKIQSGDSPHVILDDDKRTPGKLRWLHNHEDIKPRLPYSSGEISFGRHPTGLPFVHRTEPQEDMHGNVLSHVGIGFPIKGSPVYFQTNMHSGDTGYELGEKLNDAVDAVERHEPHLVKLNQLPHDFDPVGHQKLVGYEQTGEPRPSKEEFFNAPGKHGMAPVEKQQMKRKKLYQVVAKSLSEFAAKKLMSRKKDLSSVEKIPGVKLKVSLVEGK